MYLEGSILKDAIKTVKGGIGERSEEMLRHIQKSVLCNSLNSARSFKPGSHYSGISISIRIRTNKRENKGMQSSLRHIERHTHKDKNMVEAQANSLILC